MKDWNPEEWQGRSRKNYEASALGVTIALTATAILTVIYLLIKLI